MGQGSMARPEAQMVISSTVVKIEKIEIEANKISTVDISLRYYSYNFGSWLYYYKRICAMKSYEKLVMSWQMSAGIDIQYI